MYSKYQTSKELEQAAKDFLEKEAENERNKVKEKNIIELMPSNSSSDIEEKKEDSEN